MITEVKKIPLDCAEAQSPAAEPNFNSIFGYASKALYHTTCIICGESIPIYNDEKPQVCSNCRRAVLAVRKLLEDKDD